MTPATRRLVRERAGNLCEYCRLHQEHDAARFHVEHVVARQHGGVDDPSNLALACFHCNLHKGPNLAGLDPDRGGLTPLFHPRRDDWPIHFDLRGPRLFGLTPEGRTTVHVLAMNSTRHVDLRSDLLASGLHPWDVA